MYNNLVEAVKEYIGVASSMFISGVLKDLGISEGNITNDDLDKIAAAAANKTSQYKLPTPIDGPIRQAILALKG